MFSKVFKLAGLIGGGILALGTGAVGSHLAQPHLEPLLNPERKNREDQLQESFKDAEDKVEVLTRSLGELNNQGELQKTSITNLEGEVKKINGQITAIDGELSNKEKLLISKTQALQEQKNLNIQQSTKITELTEQLNEKTTELSTETDKKNKVQKELDYKETRLKLTSEEILTKKAQDQSSLKINIREVTWNGFSNEEASFSVVNYQNETKQIKVKKGDLPDHEKVAERIRKEGITFNLDESFKTWDKIFYIVRYDIDYDYKTTKKDEEKKFILTEKTTNKEIRLSEYFEAQYFEEAFRVFLAIVFLDSFPICHNWSSSDANKPYLFCENNKIGQDFFTNVPQKWSGFTATEHQNKRFNSYLYSFVTIDDFINYWTKKTIEFVRTGTVDLLDFINPIFRSKSYKPS